MLFHAAHLVRRHQVEQQHGKGNIGAKPKAEVIADIFQSTKERRA